MGLGKVFTHLISVRPTPPPPAPCRITSKVCLLRKYTGEKTNESVFSGPPAALSLTQRTAATPCVPLHPALSIHRALAAFSFFILCPGHA